MIKKVCLCAGERDVEPCFKFEHFSSSVSSSNLEISNPLTHPGVAACLNCFFKPAPVLVYWKRSESDNRRVLCTTTPHLTHSPLKEKCGRYTELYCLLVTVNHSTLYSPHFYNPTKVNDKSMTYWKAFRTYNFLLIHITTQHSMKYV